MQKLVASIALGVAAVISAPALAADPISYDYPVYKDYVPPYIPPVDHGLKGSFYLRGSVGTNKMWAYRVNHPNHVGDSPYSIQDYGFGYSYGVGAGYETGEGLRFDVTVDEIANFGMSANITGGADPGLYTLNLRSTLALANVYYDFGFDGGPVSAAGGAFGYVGAGAGIAYNRLSENGPSGTGPEATNLSLAAAAMAGVGYDFGALVADVGYRAVYINKLDNAVAADPYSIDHALIHEIRGTLRYRFN